MRKHSNAFNPFLQLTEQFQPQKIENELCKELEEKCKVFIMGGREHNYFHMESIFNLDRPVAKETAHTICAGCGYEIHDGPIFCTFCGD